MLPVSSFGGWNLIYSTLTDPNIGFRQIPLWCGYFFDESNGLVGGGNNTNPPFILRTTDGGTTWNVMNTPFQNNGHVTAIHFRDDQLGFASVQSPDFFTTSLWKTTNGGLVWTDITGQNTSTEYTCVWALPDRLVITAWHAIGGVTLDEGQTWTQQFTRPDYDGVNKDNQKSNGIYFTDALHGVVTMGPNTKPGANPSDNVSGNSMFITTDGGKTWQRTYDFIEAWSVYGVKGTQTFFLVPEGDNGSNRDVFRSDNGGKNWQPIYQFPLGHQFTGHIDGSGKTLYVQTRIQSNVKGLFRSDDLGATWKYVGGPAHDEDSRFTVAGCEGNVVYVFDRSGNIYKTIDGGDSTFLSTTGLSINISPDTLRLTARHCKPSPQSSFTLYNAKCEELIIDSLYIESPDGFTSAFVPSSTIREQSSYDGSITFASNSDTLIRTRLRIKAHNSSGLIDTSLTILALSSRAPEPYIPPLTPAAAGKEVLVPIFFKPTVDTFTVTSFEAFIRCNTDILTLNDYHDPSNIIAGASVTAEQGGFRVRGTFDPVVTHLFDPAKPVIVLVGKVTLSNETVTDVTIDSFAVNGMPALSLCTVPQSSFAVDMLCGDSLINAFIRTGDIARIESIRPNPPTSSSVTAVLSIPAAMTVHLDIVSADGKFIGTVVTETFTAGKKEVKLRIPDIASGVYFLALRTERGYTAAVRLLEKK